MDGENRNMKIPVLRVAGVDRSMKYGAVWERLDTELRHVYHSLDGCRDV